MPSNGFSNDGLGMSKAGGHIRMDCHWRNAYGCGGIVEMISSIDAKKLASLMLQESCPIKMGVRLAPDSGSNAFKASDAITELTWEIERLTKLLDETKRKLTNEKVEAIAPLHQTIQSLRTAGAKTNHDICQILGKVLGFPWYKDDLKNFPNATEAHGICEGELVAEDMANLAAERIKKPPQPQG